VALKKFHEIRGCQSVHYLWAVVVYFIYIIKALFLHQRGVGVVVACWIPVSQEKEIPIGRQFKSGTPQDPISKSTSVHDTCATLLSFWQFFLVLMLRK
jgi:hypothetical protein